jgi:hypothetical protein
VIAEMGAETVLQNAKEAVGAYLILPELASGRWRRTKPGDGGVPARSGG